MSISNTAHKNHINNNNYNVYCVCELTTYIIYIPTYIKLLKFNIIVILHSYLQLIDHRLGTRDIYVLVHYSAHSSMSMCTYVKLDSEWLNVKWCMTNVYDYYHYHHVSMISSFLANIHKIGELQLAASERKQLQMNKSKCLLHNI